MPLFLRFAPLLFFAASLLMPGSAAAQYHKVSGQVFNQRMEPLAYASVYLKDVNYGTITNDTGFYVMDLRQGSYYLVVSMVGYKTSTIYVTLLGKDLKQNIILERDSAVGRVVVTPNKTDPSLEIIQNAIAVKDRYAEPVSGYRCQLYIRATELNAEKAKKAKPARKPKPADTSAPAGPSMNMSEVVLEKNWKSPGYIREFRNAVNNRGDISGLFYLSTTDGEFNFYRNLIKIPALSETPFLSPLNPGATLAYRYKLIETYYIGQTKIYRIKVISRQTGNTQLSGELHIADSLWYIVKADLEFPKQHTSEYNRFRVIQEQEWIRDSFLMPVKLELQYGTRKKNASTVCVYSDYRFNPVWPRKFFGDELSSTDISAYEKDSSFWNQVRAVPLSAEELSFIHRNDSIRAAHERREYLDSIQRKTNRITLMRLLFTGQDHMNHLKKTEWSFRPLSGVYEFYYLGGPRVGYWVNYSKEFRNKKSINITPYFTYGLGNKDVKGNVQLFHLYDPFRRAIVGMNIGRFFDMVNPNDAYINRFRPSNFYEHSYISLWHSQELMNGLTLRTTVEFSDRSSLRDFNFNGIFENNVFPDVKAVGFDPYRAFYTDVTLSYTPFQKYIREPYEKIILGSRWPTLGINWRRGYPDIGGSAIDFDYIEFRVNQSFKLGLVGNSQWRFTSGRFLNSRSLRLIDYKFQRRGDPVLFTNPLMTFQLLDSTFSTFKWYYEGHYLHHFNGAILSKIPFMKKVGLRETVGAGFLVAPEKDYRHAEAFAGLEKVMTLFGEKFRLGIFAAARISNYGSSVRPELKISMEVFDKRLNRWSF